MILRLLILVQFSSVIKSQNFTDSENDKVFKNKIERKILRGHVLETTKDAPWTTVVLARSEQRQETLSLCTGVLISARYVLTAGHCIITEMDNKTGLFFFPDYQPWIEKEGCQMNDMIVPATYTEKFIFKFGSPCITCDNYQIVTRRAKRIILPGLCSKFPIPKWWDSNDLAIVELSEPVRFSDLIQPVKISEAYTPDLVGRQVFVAGYGVDQTDKKSNQLKFYYSNGLISCGFPMNDWFCTNSLPESQMACLGDSGAGAFVMHGGRWEMIGMLAMTVGCTGDRLGIAYFVSIFKYYDDICKYTGICDP